MPHLSENSPGGEEERERIITFRSPCESYFNEIRFESDAFLGVFQCLFVFIRFGIGSRSVTEENVVGLVERYRFRVETDGFVIFAR